MAKVSNSFADDYKCMLSFFFILILHSVDIIKFDLKNSTMLSTKL